MQYVIDCEFLQDGSQTIDLVSIGIAAEDGRGYYGESLEFDPAKANQFVRDQVLPKLGPVEQRKTRATIAQDIIKFIGNDPDPVFFAYYSAYDWVCFIELFGSFGALPQNWPKLCWDIKCLALMAGADDLPPDPADAHNALADAEWGRDALAHLKAKYALVVPSKVASTNPSAAKTEAVEGRKADPGAERTGVWSLFREIKGSVLGQGLGSVLPRGDRRQFEAIGDNTVDNLVDELARGTAIEIGQFVAGLLSQNVENFSFAYDRPQHEGFKQSLGAVVARFQLMDGSEQGDLFTKIQILFKNLMVSKYPDLGPEAAELIAVKYAKQMIFFLNAKRIQAANLAFDYQGKIY